MFAGGVKNAAMMLIKAPRNVVKIAFGGKSRTKCIVVDHGWKIEKQTIATAMKMSSAWQSFIKSKTNLINRWCENFFLIFLASLRIIFCIADAWRRVIQLFIHLLSWIASHWNETITHIQRSIFITRAKWWQTSRRERATIHLNF